MPSYVIFILLAIKLQKIWPDTSGLRLKMIFIKRFSEIFQLFTKIAIFSAYCFIAYLIIFPVLFENRCSKCFSVKNKNVQ